MSRSFCSRGPSQASDVTCPVAFRLSGDAAGIVQAWPSRATWVPSCRSSVLPLWVSLMLRNSAVVAQVLNEWGRRDPSVTPERRQEVLRRWLQGE